MTLFFFAVKGEATLKKGLKKVCKISKNLSKTMAELYISREQDPILCCKRAGTTFIKIVDENGVCAFESGNFLRI